MYPLLLFPNIQSFTPLTTTIEKRVKNIIFFQYHILLFNMEQKRIRKGERKKRTVLL